MLDGYVQPMVTAYRIITSTTCTIITVVQVVISSLPSNPIGYSSSSRRSLFLFLLLSKKAFIVRTVS